MNVSTQSLCGVNSNEIQVRLPKIKRTKTDINNIVTSYLKRRNYINANADNVDIEHGGADKQTTIENSLSSEQMAVSLFVDKSSARVNSILYSSINNEPEQIMQHYLKWLNWLCNIKEWRIQKELWRIAGPLLCHLHVEILKANHQDHEQCTHIFERLRQEYLDKYQRAHFNDNNENEIINDNKLLILYDDEENANENDDANEIGIENDERKKNKLKEISDIVLDTLQHVTTLNDIESHLDVMTFRSCKYQIQLTTNALNRLLQYLSKHSHVILIQVLQTWFDINVIDEHEHYHHFNYGNIHYQQHQPASSSLSINDRQHIINTTLLPPPPPPPPALAPPIIASDGDLLLKHLNDSISQMNEIHPPLLGYHFFNDQNQCSISASTIDDNFEYIAYATEHSDIQVYHRNCLPLITSHDTIPVSVLNTNKNRYCLLRGHYDTVYDMKFVNNNYLLSVSHDTTMKLWNYKSQSRECIVQYIGHNSPIWCMDTSAYNMYIATGSQDKSLRIWTIDNVYPLRVCSGHTLDINCIKFHPNALYIASGSADRSIRLWKINDGSIVRLLSISKSINCIDYSPDGAYLICSFFNDFNVQIWDIANGVKFKEFNVMANTSTSTRSLNTFITKLLWCKYNNYLYVATNDGFIHIYNMINVMNNEQQHTNNIEAMYTIDTKCAASIINIQNIEQHVVYIGIYN